MTRLLLVFICSTVALNPQAGTGQDDLPAGYRPKHKGGIDLATGLYTREDEDIIVPGSPALILRRTYLSGYRVSKQFGVGTTHNGEIYLSGDFQQISVIEADGSRIAFDRTPAVTSLLNATYEHPSGPAEWIGSELKLAPFGWKLKRRDGSELTFQGCAAGTTCSIIQSRDAKGRTINYRRDLSRRLARIESGDRWIAFEYDSQNRITRAHSSIGSSVEYQYDPRGRLWQVFSDDGRVHRYMYSDRDELTRIYDPGTTIENTYDANGRVIQQVNRYPGDPEPLVFTLSYQLQGNVVTEMEIERSDGEASRYTFNEDRRAIAETWSLDGRRIATFIYHREAGTQVATEITVSCTDRTGASARSTHRVPDGDDKGARHALGLACAMGDLKTP